MAHAAAPAFNAQSSFLAHASVKLTTNLETFPGFDSCCRFERPSESVDKPTMRVAMG
jgi:hypothetical protein